MADVDGLMNGAGGRGVEGCGRKERTCVRVRWRGRGTERERDVREREKKRKIETKSSLSAKQEDKGHTSQVKIGVEQITTMSTSQAKPSAVPHTSTLDLQDVARLYERRKRKRKRIIQFRV